MAAESALAAGDEPIAAEVEIDATGAGGVNAGLAAGLETGVGDRTASGG